MNLKKTLESQIRGWFPKEGIVSKVSATDVVPLKNLRKMRYRAKLAILSLLLITSAIPNLIFLFFTNNFQSYIFWLLMGDSYITVNTQIGFLEIVSKTLTLIPLKITFLELSVYIASAAIFCLGLILIAKILYKTKIKR
jgi:hypothetical protein